MKATITSSKFCSSKFLTCSNCQISSDFSTVIVLRYTVTDVKFKISTPGPDLPRTHLILSHLAVEVQRLDIQKPCNGAMCLLIFNGDLEIVFINIIFSIITE